MRRSTEPLPICAGNNIKSSAKSHPAIVVDDVGSVGRVSNLPSSRSILAQEIFNRGTLARVWWRTPAQLQEQKLKQGQMQGLFCDSNNDPLPPLVPPLYFDDSVVARVSQGMVGWMMDENETEVNAA
jgi:hypothetical protein